MKNSKKLKLILMVLICVLIILIGVIGIYTKTGNMYKNSLPDYILASDIKGSTVLEFEIDDSVESVYYDKEGKKVDSSDVTEKNEKDYKKEEIPANVEEILNVDNYEKSVEIMKKRLEFLKADQYQLDLDKETGKIVLTVSDDYIEDIESILPMEGKLQLVDSKTEEVILDNSDFKSAEATYASLDTEVITYINLKLNNSGIEKINNIDKYKEEKESKLKLIFDNDELAEISYDEILLTGKTLRVTTASGLKSDSEINSELNMNTIVSKLATIGKMPVVYNITVEEFIKNDISNAFNYMVIGLIAICVVVSLIFIFKYKLNGLLTVLGFATNVALFLIVIRLTDIEISLNSFAGILGLIALYTILANNILKAIKNKDKNFVENIKEAYLNSVDVLVVTLILVIVFSFTSMSVINTMGLLLFWGWIVTLFGTLVFTVPMLSIINKK